MSLIEELAAWLPNQRWYATKHLDPRCELAELRQLDGAYSVAFVLDRAPREPILYQVPIGVGDAPPDGVPIIGTRDEGTTWDACADPAFQALRLGLDVPPPTRMLRGEQSNTSVICDLPSGTVITKVFRVLHDGPNPDVELTDALTRAGCQSVPAFVGAAYEPYPGGEGHLQVTAEFIADAEDAWRTATESAAHGKPFDAVELGATIAEIHALLAHEMGPHEADPGSVVDSWRRRAETALETVPDLRRHRAAIDEVYEQTLRTSWPRLQRVHGDLHLGQVILASRGWVVLDFEGEPLRGLAERRLPDLALRDVAGMLRSFDYAQVASGSSDPGWAHRARHEFLTGYAQSAPARPDENDRLLRALELDKALYEAVYEARNRPDWLHVPLTGIERIL